MSMARKSTIARLPADQRAYIEQLLREDRHTLTEMISALRSKFPDTDVSRSSLHRYGAGFAEMTARMREIDRAANALVGELGEGVGEKAGALLAQAVTTLATNAALRAQNDDEITIDEVRKMAQAAKHALDTRRVSLAEREQIEEAARKRLLREQRDKLEALGKTGAIDPEALKLVMREAYGFTP